MVQVKARYRFFSPQPFHHFAPTQNAPWRPLGLQSQSSKMHSQSKTIHPPATKPHKNNRLMRAARKKNDTMHEGTYGYD